MQNVRKALQALPLAVLLSLSGCAKPEGWQYESIRTPYEAYTSSRVYRYAEGICPSMMLEGISTNCGLRVYLNLCSFALMNTPETRLSPLFIASDEASYSAFAYRLEGGQRLLFPEQTGTWIMEQIGQGHTITIRLAGHIAVFPPA